MNKYEDVIKNLSGIAGKILLSDNEKVKKLASNGVVFPPPPKNDLITIMFFLQYDNNKEISAVAKEKFLNLPETMIIEALKGNLHHYVVAGCYHYLIKQEKQSIELLKSIIKHPNFKFKLILNKLSALTTDLKSYLAEALSFISPYPEVMEFLIKSEISQAQKQKIIDFAKRNNIQLNIPQKTPIEDTTKEITDIPQENNNYQKDTEKQEKIESKTSENIEENTKNKTSPKYETEAEPVPEERKSLARIINEMNISQKIQLAMKGNMEARGLLIKQSNRMIVEAVIRNPMITEQEVVKFSADKNIHRDVIKYIANNRQWLRKYTIKMNVVLNPKTPTGRAIKLLTTLKYQDIKKIAKMRGISSTLKRAAIEYVERQEKKKKR